MGRRGRRRRRVHYIFACPRCHRACGNSLRFTRGHGGIYTRREGRVNICDCCHGSSASPPPPPSPSSSLTFYSHWLPQAQNSEPKAVEGRGRRRARWGETEMSEGAGSYNVSGRWRVSVCRPLRALRRKAREAKRWGSAQPRAQSTRRVLLLRQISMGLLVQISMGKLRERPRVGIPRG